MQCIHVCSDVVFNLHIQLMKENGFVEQLFVPLPDVCASFSKIPDHTY